MRIALAGLVAVAWGGIAAAAPTGFQAVEAPPGGTIVRLAVTPANDAALTIDDADEVRLWPTLDGTRAPLAVELPAARAVALQPAGPEFAVLEILDAGAALVRLDARGHRLAVRELPAADGVAAVDAGFVTWRGTRLTWLDLDGTSRATLDARARVTGIVAAASGAIATVGGAPRSLALRRPDGQPAALVLGGPPPRPAPPRVTARNSDLVIATADGPHYLGYAYLATRDQLILHNPNHPLVRGAAGWLQIDADLAPGRELIPPAAVHATDIKWLAADDWLLQGPAGLWLWIAGQPTAALVRPKAVLLDYNPDSRLALLQGHQLARYAPDRRAFDDVAFTGWSDDVVEIRLLSPGRAHGALLLLTRFWRTPDGAEHSSVQWIHDLAHPELDPEQPADGTQVARLDPFSLNSPDGTRWLLPGSNGRTFHLTDRTGHIVWTLPMPGGQANYPNALFWLDASHAWLVDSHGVAAIDLARGALGPATGWRFELGRAPHTTSEIGRPFACDLATGRDGSLVFPGDAAFQAVVRDVASRTATRVLWWGPIRLDGAPHRAAMVVNRDLDADPLFAALVELAPDQIVAATITAWGFDRSQIEDPGIDPVWGSVPTAETAPIQHTIDLRSFEVESSWTHMSFEQLAFTVERGRFVVVADEWMERDNNGHGFDTSANHKKFPAGRRPPLATYKPHAMKIAISAPAHTAEALAAGIHRLPPD